MNCVEASIWRGERDLSVNSEYTLNWKEILKMSKYTYGQEALMPQGKPFRLAIEGVDREFELVHRIDDEGQIRMSLDVADTSRRRSMQDVRRPPHIQHDIDDDTAYDEHGALLDGHSVRVPMREMRDANRNEPLIINTPFNLRREFHADGTPRNRRDGSSRRSRQADPTITQADDHKPGFRLGDGRATVDAKVAAYNEMVSDLQTAWMSPEQRARNTSVTADAAPPAGISAADFARFQMIQEMSDAWRPRDADPNGLSTSTGASTRATASVPPVGAYCPAGFGAKPGDPCVFEGSPVGKLVERDGWLFCEFTPLGPTRPDSTSDRTMTADQAQAIKDQAYKEMCDDLVNAWKG
jgi:hypothetical protein